MHVQVAGLGRKFREVDHGGQWPECEQAPTSIDTFEFAGDRRVPTAEGDPAQAARFAIAQSGEITCIPDLDEDEVLSGTGAPKDPVARSRHVGLLRNFIEHEVRPLQHVSRQG